MASRASMMASRASQDSATSSSLDGEGATEVGFGVAGASVEGSTVGEPLGLVVIGALEGEPGDWQLHTLPAGVSKSFAEWCSLKHRTLLRDPTARHLRTQNYQARE